MAVDIGSQSILCKPFHGVVYSALNRHNGKIYIGQTSQPFLKRVSAHKRQSIKSDMYFHRAVRKYGFEAFEWSQIDQASSQEELNSKEKSYISGFGSTDPAQGYNRELGGYKGRPGPETIELMRKAQLGKKHRPESIAKMKGHSVSEKTIAAVRKACLGRVQSEEEKSKRAASLRGKVHSAEARARMSAAAKKRYVDPEQRRLASEMNKGHAVSEEQKAKLRAWALAHPLSAEARVRHRAALSSPEVRAKMSISQQSRSAVSDATRAKLSAAARGRKMSAGALSKAWDTRRLNSKLRDASGEEKL